MSVTAWVVIGVVLLVLWAVFAEPMRDYIRKCEEDAVNPRMNWRFVAFGGGAVDLEGLTRNQAITHCAQNFGEVAYIDDTHNFIFYKPKGWKREPLDMSQF